MKHSALIIAFLFVFGSCLSGCSLVDEDLRDCGGEYRIDYRLRLMTNMQTELETVLYKETDREVSSALGNYLKDIFSDFAHDIDLSFYSCDEDMPRRERLRDIMDDNRSSYTLYLPVGNYFHTGVANLMENASVSLEDDAQCKTARLVQHPENAKGDGGALPDTVSSHGTGIFSARKKIDVVYGRDQLFKVELYMVNSATALVLDTKESGDAGRIRVVATGFADSFELADSCYRYSANPVIRTESLKLDDTRSACYAAVHFPSMQKADENGHFWSWRVYAPAEDGSITESVLGVSAPLKPGQLKIVKARVHGTGIVSVTDPTVGVSVTLNWQQGGQHDVEM